MVKAGDRIYQVSGSSEDTSRRFFATRKAAEKYLREEPGAMFDERMGWHLEDETGNVVEHYSIDEFILG